MWNKEQTPKVDNENLSPLDDQLKKIEQKDFSIPSFDKHLDKIINSPENSKKLFEVTKTSLQDLDTIKTLDQANKAKNYLQLRFDKLPPDIQTLEQPNLLDITTKIDARIKILQPVATIQKAADIISNPENKDLNPSQVLQKSWLFDKEAVREDVQKTFDEVIKQFWGALLSIFELFWGKGALRSFCDAFHLDYDTHFASIENLYNDTYQLNDKQSAVLKNIYTSSNDEIFANRIVKGPDGKEWDFTPNNVQSYYAKKEWLGPNFNLLDPVLINRAMKKDPKIAVPNLIVSSGSVYGENTYKINETIPLSWEQKTAIFAELTKDPSLWSSVNALGGPDVASKVYGKENLNKNQLWNSKKPSSPKERAVAYGACLMKWSSDLKYVLSQSDMPYEKDKSQAKPETSTTPETSEVKTEWTTFFATAEWNDRKNYPLTEEKVKNLSWDEKTKYDTYKKTVSEKVLQLLNPNNKDAKLVLSDTPLKTKLLSFLSKHFSVYLANLSTDTKMYAKNRQSIDSVISKFRTISSTPSFEFTDDFLSIKWKDDSTPAKDIEIKTTDFSWLPILKKLEVATNKNTKTKQSIT